MAGENESSNWLAVIGKAAAFLCLAQADMRDKGLADRAAFLEALGVSRRDAASMLGSTPASVTEVINRAKRKKRSGKKKDR